MKSQIKIEQVRKNKIEIEIKTEHSYTREFIITINSDGLIIESSKTLSVLPRATNKIIVDCMV